MTKRATTATAKGRPVYIVDGSRTPQLKARGQPGPFRASDLAVTAGRSMLLRQPFQASALDEVIVGCVMPGPDEANIGRVIALRLGCGVGVTAWTVQRNCASGMQALDCAFRNISAGRSDLVLAGGVEAMSHAPLLMSEAMVRWLAGWNTAKGMSDRLKRLRQLRLGYLKPIIGLLRGLTDPIVGLSMGQTAENLAYRFGISREAMDAFALQSHQRLAAAQDGGLLDNEVEPLYDPAGACVLEDDGLRRDSSMERLGRLKPVFDRPQGLVTAGNSAQVTDGAAMLLLASEKAVKEYDLPVLARIVDCEWAGIDPAEMGLGPAYAMAAMLKRRRLKVTDIDCWEINEAFAAQVLACLEAWKDPAFCRSEFNMRSALGEIDMDRLNVDGGGIALGHPVGASGARIVLHTIRILERTQGHYGMASLCIGGGQGGAMLVERG